MNERSLLDPTPEHAPATRQRAAMPASLAGLTIGLLDISKPRGDVLLDQLEARFAEHDVKVKRYSKPTYAKPAPLDVGQTIATECDVVVEALAD